MVDESVLPEDVGTGAPYGDFDDAANLASMIHRPNNVNFVVSGLELQPDFVQQKCYLTSGRAIVEDTEAQATESEDLREYGVAYSAIMKARTSSFETNNDVLELANDTMNYVHVAVHLDQGDSPFIYVDQDDTGPNHPSFKIGEIDTSSESVSEVNRDANIKAETIKSETLTVGDSPAITGINENDIREDGTLGAPLEQLSVNSENRNWDTYYQNTTGNPIVVYCGVQPNSSTQYYRYYIQVGEETTSAQRIHYGYNRMNDSTHEFHTSHRDLSNFIVPNNYYYYWESSNDTGNNTNIYTYEQELSL